MRVTTNAHGAPFAQWRRLVSTVGILTTRSGNPWLGIPLADYESHMARPDVGQSRFLADELRAAALRHGPESVAVVGCAGGNGLEGLAETSVRRILAIDINPDYVAATGTRHGRTAPGLELLVADIAEPLPPHHPADLVFAGLVLEYVACVPAFAGLRSLCAPGGRLVVVTQVPSETLPAVSPSPHRSLDALRGAMRLVEPPVLAAAAGGAGFVQTQCRRRTLASGKAFLVAEYQ